MDKITKFKEELESRILEFISEISDKQLREAVRYAALPLGKCLRSYLFATLFEYANTGEKEMPWNLAVSIELIHVASLIHDDIIDNHTERRGKLSTVHKYGLPLAILVGDHLIFKAFDLIGDNPKMVRLVSEIGLKLCTGASMEMGSPLYYSCVSLKTAVFFRNVCLMAVIQASRTDLIPVAEELGEIIGTLYQIRDDTNDGDVPLPCSVSDTAYTLSARLDELIREYSLPLQDWGDAFREVAVGRGTQ